MCNNLKNVKFPGVDLALLDAEWIMTLNLTNGAAPSYMYIQQTTNNYLNLIKTSLSFGHLNRFQSGFTLSFF